MLPWVPLQSVPLVLMGPWLTSRGPRPTGAVEQNGGSLAMAQTPQHLQRGMLGMLWVAEGAGQHHRVTINGTDLRLDVHRPAVVRTAAQD